MEKIRSSQDFVLTTSRAELSFSLRVLLIKFLLLCFFYLGFLSRTLIFHRTAWEGGDYLCNTFLPLLPASQKYRH